MLEKDVWRSRSRLLKGGKLRWNSCQKKICIQLTYRFFTFGPSIQRQYRFGHQGTHCALARDSRSTCPSVDFKQLPVLMVSRLMQTTSTMSRKRSSAKDCYRLLIQTFGKGHRKIRAK